MKKGAHNPTKVSALLHRQPGERNYSKLMATSGFGPINRSFGDGTTHLPTTMRGFSINTGSCTLSKQPKKFSEPEAASTPITVNLANCRYPVVHECMKRKGWKIVSKDDDQSQPWDVYWADTAQPVEYFKGLQLYQKVNHFPGMFNIHRKNHLADHLEKMRKHHPDLYKFYPKTWLLPKNYPEVLQSLKQSKTLIAKPCDQSQGRGIFILTDPEDLSECSGKKLVIQEYIERPLIFNNLKFDLRIYVLVMGCDPLRLFIFEDGLVRFATEHYERPTQYNKKDRYKHLTNYAVNKHNEKFYASPTDQKDLYSFSKLPDHPNDDSLHRSGVQGKDMNSDPEPSHSSDEGMEDSQKPEEHNSHKQSLLSFFAHLTSLGYRMSSVWAAIQRLSVLTLLSIQPRLAHSYRVAHTDDPFHQICFELLGLDVLVDWGLGVHLLEVNHAPSLRVDSEVDRKVKGRMISELVDMMGVSVDSRKKLFELKKEQMAETSLTGRRSRLAQGEVKEECLAYRASFLEAHSGGFQKIYPTDDPRQNAQYAELLKQAESNYHEYTGAEMISAEAIRAMKHQENQQKGGAFKSHTFSNLKTTSIPGVSSENINSFAPKTLQYSQIESLYGNTSGLRRLKELVKQKPQRAQIFNNSNQFSQTVTKQLGSDPQKSFKIRSGAVSLSTQKATTPTQHANIKVLLPYDADYGKTGGIKPLKQTVFKTADRSVVIQKPKQTGERQSSPKVKGIHHKLGTSSRPRSKSPPDSLDSFDNKREEPETYAVAPSGPREITLFKKYKREGDEIHLH